MKSNKKRILFVLAILTMALVLSCALVACDKKGTGDKTNSNDLGVYYEVVGSSLDEKSYIELKSGNVWYDGEDQGTFKISGGNITLYDGDMELMSGTISNGVLTLSFMGETTVYKKSGSMSSGNVDQKAMIKSIQNGKVDGLTVSLEIDNTVEDVDLSGMITTSKDCSWQLYTSRTATSADAIVTKIIVPKNGNNTYYIVVTSADGKINRTYTLNVWKNYYVTLSFYANGTFYTSEQVLTHTTYGSGPSCSVAGYTFNGWGCDGYYVTESKSFNANLTPLTYSAKFDSNGGSTVSDKTATFNKDLSLPSPYKTGYTFLGWYINGNLYNDSIKYTYTNDVTFTARWQINSYNVKIVSDDETCGTVNSFDGEKQYKSSVNLIATTKTDIINSKCTLVFVGWFGNDVFLSSNLTYTATTPSNDIVYTAKWAKITISSNNSQAGSIAGLKAINKVGDSLTITASTNLGYEFLGWYDGYKMVSDKATFTFAMPNTTKALVAKYKVADEMENFVFSSDQTSCIINGIKNKNITGIVVPNYVTRIGNSSFSGCSKLTSVTIGSGVTNIGSSVFDNCTELTSIVVVDGNTIYHSDGNCLIVTKNETLILGCKNSIIPSDGSVTSISERAFYNCTGLTSITIPDSVTSIGKYAFNGCTGLTSVTINGTVTKIDNHVFYYCRSLTTITIPESVTSIGDYAFYNCTGLTSITIPDSVTSIGKYAFSVCNGLTNISGSATNVCTVAKQANPSSFVVYITSGDSIDEKAFYYDTGLTGVTIGNSITNIGNSAFSSCEKLSSITIGNGVTNIGEKAFYDCKGLISITIPSGVTSIGNDAFSGCSALASIVVSENNSAFSSDHGILYDKNKTQIIHVPYAIQGAITVPDSVTSIGRSAFYGRTGFTSITIPNSVTSIGEEAFSYCTRLTNIIIPNSVTSIGKGAFQGCSSLESITIPFVGKDKATGSSYTSVFGYIFGYTTTTDSSTKVYNATMQYSSSYISTYTYYWYYIPSSLKNIVLGDTATTIPYSAFQNCTNITSITLPDSVTSIREKAFSGCKSLVSITGNAANVSAVASQAKPTSFTVKITSGTSIGKYAFKGCSGLTSITIPDSVTSIGDSAFYGCSGLTSITIPDGITSISKEAFSGCTSLKSITIPDSVTSIGSSAFYGCSSLTSITIPDSVTSIGDSAFNGCTGLTGVTIPVGVTSIGGFAFSNCSGLTTVNWNATNCQNSNSYNNIFARCSNLTTVNFGNNVTIIHDYIFGGCTGLTHITIPDSVTSISRGAFYDTAWYNNQPDGVVYAGKVAYTYKGSMPDNTSITIKDGTLRIGANAFNYYEKLTSVKIPNSVTSIGGGAFADCSGLTSVTIGNGMTSIGEGAFAWCKGLTSVKIPGSVKSIGDYAFRGCSGLTSVTIGKGVTSIGNSAFEDCKGLTSITIPDSVTSIGNRAFYGCTGHTSIYYTGDVAGWCKISGLDNLMSKSHTLYIDGKKVEGDFVIPDNVTSIVDYAFYNCTGLTSVTIPDSVTSIGKYAFGYCKGLTSIYYTGDVAGWCGISGLGSVMSSSSTLYIGGKKVTGDLIIPDGVTKISDYAFYNCSEIKSITIPNSVTSIGKYAFGYCTGLTSVTIGNSVTSIGDSAFSGCTGLTSIYYTGDVAGWCGISGLGSVMSSSSTLYIGGKKVEGDLIIPDSVTNIGGYAFYGCEGLTSVTFGNSVTSIGDYAFRGCTGLSSVTIPDSVTSIGERAFYYCAGLTRVTIGNSVTRIGAEAFRGCTRRLVNIAVAVGNTKYHSADNCLIETESKTLILGCKNSVIPTDGSVTNIGDSAFDGCIGLTSVTIPDSVKSIGESAFRGCTGLSSVTIGNGVTSIGWGAFSGCTGLTSVTIPGSVKSIGKYAFVGCSGLTSINFNGMIAQWKAISKGTDWNNSVPATEVVCKDGTVSI